MIVQRTLVVPNQTCLELEQLWAAEAPREICGFFLGASTLGHVLVERFIAVRNAQAAPDSFAISDSEMRRVEHLSRSTKSAIVALFHGHPSGQTALSPRDEESFRSSPWPWVIVCRSARSSSGDLEFHLFDQKT